MTNYYKMNHLPIRVPGSRPFRLSSQKEKPVREQSWDNRFHLGKIPDYNALQDKYIDQNRIRKIRKKIILLPNKIKKPNPPSQSDLAKCVSVKGFKKPPVIQNQIVSKLTNSLVSAWDHKNIPNPQREAFLFAISHKPAKDKSSALVKEVEMLKNDNSPVQMALRAVYKREECLKDLIDFANSVEVATNNVKHNCVENLIKVRSLSIQAVESIILWKKKLLEIGSETDPVFEFNGENYLYKMQNDLRLLKTTSLGLFIEFLENDPFLIYNSGTKDKIEIPVEPSLMKKIKEAESLLKSEGMKDVVREKVEEIQPKLNECRSSRVFLKEEAKEMSLESISSNVEELILQYSLMVPESIQESMGKVENCYQNALTMRYPAFFWAKIDKEIVGLVIFNLENQKSMHKRLYISHLSMLQVDMFGKVLEILLSYIWNNYECIEIRIGIISKINEQGKYEADKSIKQYFDKTGFRWKQMIYTINETPVQLLGLRRPESIIYNKTGFSIFDDCIEMAYACTLQLGEAKTVNKKTSFCSIVGVVCAIKACGSSNLPEIQEIMNKMKGIPPAFRFRKDFKLENAIKDLNSVNLSVLALENDLETSVSCSALGLSWSKYLPSQYNGYSYTKVISPVNIMSSGDYTVYIISTEDPSYSVFFIPTFVPNNAFEFAKNLLKSIQARGEANEIWIPSFNVEAENDIETVTGSEVDNKVVTRCVESYKFKMNSALHPSGSLIETPDEQALIVVSDFIYGMIHHRIDEELEVPLFVVQVTSDKFLK